MKMIESQKLIFSKFLVGIVLVSSLKSCFGMAHEESTVRVNFLISVFGLAMSAYLR